MRYTSSPTSTWEELTAFQILRETGRLAGFIRWVAKQRPDGRIALVLNGDVIDTLAEESGGYIAVDNAEATVRRIIGDPRLHRCGKLSQTLLKPKAAPSSSC